MESVCAQPLAADGPAWFETRGMAALLTMRMWQPVLVQTLILRSIAERCVSKDEAPGGRKRDRFV
jgi:hypothetical protein